MKKLSDFLNEQHREKGRFKPTVPRNVPSKVVATPKLNERCWTGYRQIGMKRKGDKVVPNCVQDSVEIPTDAPSVESIAKKHGVTVAEIEKQLKMGMKIEAEHGKSKGSEKEIALDHLNEKPDYYTKLKKFVEDVSGKQEMQVQGTAAMTLTDKPNKEPMKKLKEASAAAIAAATAISKKKSGNYDKKGMRIKPYKNPDAPNVKSNAERRKEMNEAKDMREYDYEGDMAKTQLKTIIRNAENMHDMLEDNDNLPEWVQSKITLAKDYIVTAANYMESEMKEEVKKSDIPAILRKQQGQSPLKLSDLKRKDTISDKENLAKLRNEGAVPAKEKTVMVRHKTSGKELVVTQQKAKELQKHEYHPVKEEVEQIDEKNVPTSPEKWARAKALAKSKFDVYPSAYANGWAAKKYKEMGGGWKSVSEETEQTEQINELSKSTLASYATKAADQARNKKDAAIGYVRSRKGLVSTGEIQKSAKADQRIEGIKGAIKRLAKEEVEQIDELSNELLHRYKEKAAEDSLKADKEGNYKKGDKRFSGVIKATNKQFDKRKTMSMEQVNKDESPFVGGSSKTTQKAVPGKYGAGYSTARHLARMAMKKQVEKMKKMPIKEESKKAAIVKEVMKKKKTSEDAFQKDPEMSTTLTKV